MAEQAMPSHGLARIDPLLIATSAGWTPPDLPAPLTTFVGRDAEIATVSAMLGDPANRLVTLTGPGGVGKTRLALRVVADLRDEFDDGVAFVALDRCRHRGRRPARSAPARTRRPAASPG